jgi:gamma-glutamyltranspeptidase/glutathione hydrolase
VKSLRAATILVALLAAACNRPSWREAVPDGWPYALDSAPVSATKGMVVSTSRYASDVGAAVLAAGGNAIDAAVATAFVLAVVNPEAGNIGGGGFMIVRLADGTTAALDFRERAPGAASRDMYLDEAGELTDGSVVGHRAVGVPGSVAGLWEVHRRYGRAEWGDLLAPAIRSAEGFVVTDRLARSLRHYSGDLTQFPYTSAIFLRDGAAPDVGDTLVQSDLARTLQRIQEHGRDGFYAGETARLIIDEMRRGGGIISAQDLASYQPSWRQPIEFTYRGYSIVSMPPSSSGGITLALMARILEGYELSRLPWHSPQMIHLLAESWKRAYADRNEYLGDPDFVSIPTTRLISAAYGMERRAGISLERATPSGDVLPGLGPYQPEGNTTHLSVVDSAGNAVSLTTTINSFYGIKAVVGGAGFFLNNEMDDFAARPSTPNMFGLVQGEANAIAPGKRMLSAMTPTMVLRPDRSLFLVLGSPGGATIITNVFQNIMNVVDYGMNILEAVHAPRLHHQHLPDRIDYELDALDDATIAVLEAMGHSVNELHDPESLYPYIGDVQAIMVLPDGMFQGVSDPRRGGAAVGF